ncbi:MAG TPA: transposase [Thermoanaerobaculia bacterium]|nr:transposase [Thermoanaerobaculia bacterium]
MARPLRLEYPGALFHVTARGNERRDTFRDDDDRRRFLDYLREAVERFRWIVTAYVLMPNHFHLVVELTETTLSSGMQWLNGAYSQAFNRRHDRVGHLFQGRFKAPLIEKEAYFLEVARYVVLNPVRAQMIARPEDYAWSSYRAVIGDTPAPDWLATDDLLAHFGDDRDVARARYRAFVNDGISLARNPWVELVGQIYLGSESWVERVRQKIELKPRSDAHPRVQRLIGRPAMTDIVAAVAEALRVAEDSIRRARGGAPRKIAAWLGCHEGLLTNSEIAAGLRMRSSGHVTGLIQRCDQELEQSERLRLSIDRCLATLRRRTGETKL